MLQGPNAPASSVSWQPRRRACPMRSASDKAPTSTPQLQPHVVTFQGMDFDADRGVHRVPDRSKDFAAQTRCIALGPKRTFSVRNYRPWGGQLTWVD
jgi:hypothetical protein